MKYFAAAMMVSLLLLAGPQVHADTVAEPPDYRMDEYKAPVPATLKGATVVSTEDVEKLLSGQDLVLIDVMPHTPKPDKLPPGTIWRDKERKDIPGSIWLANTGYGALSAETEKYFESALDMASAKSKDRNLLFYCMTDCWMSWNAARRAVALGYTHVLWYPAGADGWEKAGHELQQAQPLRILQ